MPEPLARVVLLGGASGSGKSRIAERCGLPVLRLDDFYRTIDDPLLPRLPTGEVDWDHPASWHRERAMAAIEELATTGATEAPNYDISTSSSDGTSTLLLGDARTFVAEGVFVAELAAELRERGLLADALCVQRSRWVTMALRFARDLSEHRKPPIFLARRGLRLARLEPTIVGELTAAGFRPMRVRRITRTLAREAPLQQGIAQA